MTMFTRVQTEAQVRDTVAMMKREFGASPMDRDRDFIRILAPDGDLVFSALRMGPGRDYICRYHTEVFDPGSFGSAHESAP